jgi:hypothetical protein
MHGSIFEGDGEKELISYAAMIKEELTREASSAA